MISKYSLLLYSESGCLHQDKPPGHHILISKSKEETKIIHKDTFITPAYMTKEVDKNFKSNKAIFRA